MNSAMIQKMNGLNRILHEANKLKVTELDVKEKEVKELRRSNNIAEEQFELMLDEKREDRSMKRKEFELWEREVAAIEKSNQLKEFEMRR